MYVNNIKAIAIIVKMIIKARKRPTKMGLTCVFSESLSVVVGLSASLGSKQRIRNTMMGKIVPIMTKIMGTEVALPQMQIKIPSRKKMKTITTPQPTPNRPAKLFSEGVVLFV